MSNSNLHNDEIAYGPSCSKKLKVQLPPQMEPHQIKINSIRNRPQTPAGPLNLCDLPTEILMKIIGYINIWDHNFIRATSKLMKDISDDFVMQAFNEALANHLCQNPCSYQSAVLRTLKQATEVFVQSGCKSLFCGCILPMLRSSDTDPFCPQTDLINKFLLHFFDMVKYVIGDPTSQKSRLLYILTLMRLLRAFNTSTEITSRSLRSNWHIVIELKGHWLRSMGRSQNKTFKQKDLLLILSEFLISSIAGRTCRHLWHCGVSGFYSYGNVTSTYRQKRVRRILFKITGNDSKEIFSLFCKCLEEDPSQFIWPPKWPKAQFTVNVNINRKMLLSWF